MRRLKLTKQILIDGLCFDAAAFNLQFQRVARLQSKTVENFFRDGNAVIT